MKAVVAAFNQEKALVGAFSVITNLRMVLFQALSPSVSRIAISSLNKVPRRIDVAGGGQYPNIVSGKDLTDKKSLQNSVILTAGAEEDEDSTEEAPNILQDDGPSDDQNLEVGDGDTELDSFELTDTAQVETLELENFELSEETDSSEAEVAATTFEPLEEDLEITTISN